jgi:CRP-like cAMP-binding protein
VGISIGDIRGIFVSHIHDDHVVDLYRFAWNGYRRIELVTSAEVREQVLRKFSALWGVSRDEVDGAFIWRLVVPGKPFLINGVSVTLHYGAHPIPSLGGRFELGGEAFGITGDTSSKSGPMGLDRQLDKGLMTTERHAFLATFPSRQFTLCDAGEATIHGVVKDFECYDAHRVAIAHRSDIPPPYDQKLTLAGPLFSKCFKEANHSVLDATVVTEVIASLGSRLTHWVNRFLQAQTPRNVRPGEVVVHQGDPHADCVYLVLAGTAEVVVDGRSVATLERGSFFGEQSILKNVPRNASVRAVSALRVLPVAAPLFLEFIAEDAEESARRPARHRNAGTASIRERLERVWAHRQWIGEAFGGRLSQNGIHALAAEACVVEVAANEPLPVLDEPNELWVVARGKVEVLSARRVMLAAGDVVGGIAPVGFRRCVVPAVAREPSVLLRLPSHTFEQLLVNTPGLRKRVEACLARTGRRLRFSGARSDIH